MEYENPVPTILEQNIAGPGYPTQVVTLVEDPIALVFHSGLCSIREYNKKKKEKIQLQRNMLEIWNQINKRYETYKRFEEKKCFEVSSIL